MHDDDGVSNGAKELEKLGTIYNDDPKKDPSHPFITISLAGKC